MFFPALVDAAVENPDWQVFMVSAGVAIFSGGCLVFANQGRIESLSTQQAFILTVSAWVVIPAFGAFPFVFSELRMSYTDALFEAMSGVTTTGSTVITGLDGAPPGILLWRALLQWFGGVGVVLMAISIFPMLKIGGMQLFRTESFDVSEKLYARAPQLAAAISITYIVLTLLCGISLWLAGMTPFEALVHALTTIATGGYSTSDGSIGSFDSALIDYLVVVFMIVGSLPFVLYLKAASARDGRPIIRDSQVRAFLTMAMALVLFMTILLWQRSDYDLWTALRYASFNVVSIMTGTGFATTDYGLWGPFAVSAFFFIMLIGGCAGSTSCGIKIFRFQVLGALLNVQLRKMIQPSGIFIARYNGMPIKEAVSSSVVSFLFLFVVSFVVIAFALAMTGLDFITAISAAATAIANVGPALGPTIGPAGTFQSLPDVSKWIITFAMLLGRLELFAILVMLTPWFWRQ
ncbi:MAG: potassium transporter TrkH [Kordiimonas sp.]|nr:potassium transporter TrkH [Kordiimonas sp.]